MMDRVVVNESGSLEGLSSTNENLPIPLNALYINLLVQIGQLGRHTSNPTYQC